MVKRFLLLLCVIASFTTLVSAQSATPSLDEILSNYFENTGGIDNWKKLESMKMKGTMAMGGMEFAGTITTARPNKQRVDVDIQGQKLVQSYDGEDAWWINPFQSGPDPQPMPAEIATDFTKEEFESPFIDYAGKGHQVEVLGTKEVDGTQTYEVKLTKKNGDVQFYYFDTEHFVPIMQKQEISQGPNKGQYVETYLSDYQEVDGLIVPHFLETKMAGQSVNKITISEVKLNPELEAGIFSRPKK